MSSRIFAIVALGTLTALSAVSAVGPTQPTLVRPKQPGKSPLHMFGNRSMRQLQSAAGSKFDAALAEIARHSNRVSAEHALEDLHSLNPAARFMQQPASSSPLVLVDAITRGNPQELKVALVGLGLQRAALFSNDVSGWLPIDQLDAASELAEVHAIRASMSRTRIGAVTSQGDYAQNSDLVRSQNALTGSGITVGVLSDSYDCYQTFADDGVPASGNAGYAFNGVLATASNDISTGDLPSTVTVLKEATCMNGPNYNGYPLQLPLGDEGRAMLQIVHDVAPGAALAFYTAVEGEADFAAGITQLASNGAKVIVDDVGYFDEPFYQDGLIAQAINTVQAQGVSYFTSAGNDGTLAYNNNSPIFSTAGSGPNAGEQLLNFDTSNNSVSAQLPVTLPAIAPGDFVAVVVEWDQPYVTGAPDSGGATSQIDVCVTNVVGNDDITNDNLNPLPTHCTGANALHSDPVQVMLIGNPANAAGNSSAETFNVEVGLAGGSTPGRIKVAIEGDGIQLTIKQFATNSGTVQGHSSAASAMSVGAAFFANTPACGLTPATLEYFSAVGGDPILFDSTGLRLAAPLFRQKPDLIGPDGGNNTFLGFTLARGGVTDSSNVAGCQNNASYPNFFGTSAAAPHVGSIAALLLQADPSLTPDQIYTFLQQSASPMGTVPVPTSATFNFAAGYGFVQADLAAQMIPAIIPAAPTLTLASSSIVTGSSTTITWSSANTTGCTASGSWSGALASSGSQTVSPTAVGSDTYSILCSNVAGNSPATATTLSVTAAAPPASSGGGGGGGLGLESLLGLFALVWARAQHLLRARARAAI